VAKLAPDREHYSRAFDGYEKCQFEATCGLELSQQVMPVRITIAARPSWPGSAWELHPNPIRLWVQRVFFLDSSYSH